MEPVYAPGTRLGPYRIVEPLGAGAMASVYVAEHHLIGRRVAIKVTADHFADHPEALELFFHEARAANRIAHPNIVQVTDLVEARAGDPPFMVMELLDGFTLREVIDATGAIPARRVAEIAESIASAMAAAHEAKVIHRDLKPGNVFLCNRSGAIKVLDFGIARLAGVHASTDELTCGTPLYISPEQAGADEVDWRTDIYSLGATLYEALAGRPVFDYENVRRLLTAHIADTPEPLELPEPDAMNLAVLVMRCLEKARRDRPASMDAIADEARALIASWRSIRETMNTAELEARIDRLWDM
jgi:serine/threonine-protein kinase